MNMELRAKLKKMDTELTKLGYYINPYAGTFYISRTEEMGSGVDSYIRLYEHKTSIGNDLYRLTFSCEPCKLPGGSDYMSIELAEGVCAYWKKVLGIAKVLNELNIVGTREDIIECVADIAKKRRKQLL